MEVWLVWESIHNDYVPNTIRLIGGFSTEDLAIDYAEKLNTLSGRFVYYVRRLPLDYLT